MDSLPLARLLATVTRALVDDMHAALAEAGHDGLRPAYGFALNAIGEAGATTAGLARTLGMTKQGAAKLVDALGELGYIRRVAHADDARARLVVLTPAGRNVLERAADVQRRLEEEWGALIGVRAVRQVRSALERVLAARDDDEPLSPRPSW